MRSLDRLYVADNYHPDLPGSYLNACVFLGTIMEASPRGNPFCPEPLTLDVCSRLQEVAHDVVFDRVTLKISWEHFRARLRRWAHTTRRVLWFSISRCFRFHFLSVFRPHVTLVHLDMDPWLDHELDFNRPYWNFDVWFNRGRFSTHFCILNYGPSFEANFLAWAVAAASFHLRLHCRTLTRTFFCFHAECSLGK